MKVFSASQAVWPAIERTQSYLFRPFALGTFFKLSAAAIVTEGVLLSFRFSISTPAASDSDSAPLGISSTLAVPGFVFFAALAAAAAVLIGLLAFYLVTQFRFAFFHCLVYRTHEIRTAWPLYRLQTERLFKASLLVGLALLMLAMLAVGVVILCIDIVFTLRTEDGKLDPGFFLILFVPCATIVLVLLLAAVAAQIVMHDFVLPHMALENATFGEAWRQVRSRMRAHRETFVSYFILRLLLPAMAAAVLGIAAMILLKITLGILGLSAAGFNAMLEDATGAGAFIRIALNVLFALLGLAIGSSVAIVLGGPLAVYIRHYALLFYGGHYKPLGELLHAGPISLIPNP